MVHSDVFLYFWATAGPPNVAGHGVAYPLPHPLDGAVNMFCDSYLSVGAFYAKNVTLVLSQTPAKPRTRSYCTARCARLRPSFRSHSSQCSAVRTMSVKYRKWRFFFWGGRVLQLRNLSTDLHKTWHQWSTIRSHTQNLVTISLKGAWLRMREIRR